MKKTVVFILTFVIALGSLAACDGSPPEDSGGLSVAAATFPEYDISRAIAGDRASIRMLVPPGASAHSFEPSPGDIKNLRRTDVFIYIGCESDLWIENVLKALDTSDMKIIRLTEHIDPLREEVKPGMQADEDEPGYDGHIWSSPKNAIKLIGVICDEFCENDGENADFYRANASAYREALEAVDAEFTEVIENAKRKKIVVADKFPFLYFTRAYGLDYEAAFPGCAEQADASPATIARLVETVKEEKIPYVYYAELSNASAAKAVAEQTGAGTLPLNSCHNVSRADFDAGATYLSLMRDNLENLRKGLI